ELGVPREAFRSAVLQPALSGLSEDDCSGHCALAPHDGARSGGRMQPEERRAFEGKWTAISGRLGASEIPLPDTVFTLSGAHYAVESGNGRDEGRLVWGTQAEPQA